MALIDGYPDWTGSFLVEGSRVLPTYGNARQFFTIPTAVRLAMGAAGVPDFRLEFLIRDGEYKTVNAVMHMRLTATHNREDALASLRQKHSEPSLVGAPLSSPAYWRLKLPNRPEVVREFAWEGVDTATVAQRLDADLGNVLYQHLLRVLKSGALLTQAAVECEVAGILPLVPVTVSGKTVDLLDAIRKFSGDEAGVSYEFLRTALVGPKGSTVLGSKITVKEHEGPSNLNRDDFARALLGNIRTKLGAFVPAPAMDKAPYIGLKVQEGPGKPLPDQVNWDLSKPLLAATPLSFRFDPFQGASDLVKSKKLDPEKQFQQVTRVPSLNKGNLNLFIRPSLPPKIQGVEALQVDLKITAAYTDDGRPYRTTIDVYPLAPAETENPSVEVLKFGSKAKTYCYQISVIPPAGKELRSTWTKVERTWDDPLDEILIIGLNELPAGHVAVSTTERLREQCTIEAALLGPGDAAWGSATIDGSTPKGFIVTQHGLARAQLKVTARSHRDRSRSICKTFPARSLLLDIESFPESGPKTVALAVDVSGPGDGAELQILPEGTDTPQFWELAPESTTKT